MANWDEYAQARNLSTTFLETKEKYALQSNQVVDYQKKIKKVYDSFKTSVVPDYNRWKLAKIKQAQE